MMDNDKEFSIEILSEFSAVPAFESNGVNYYFLDGIMLNREDFVSRLDEDQLALFLSESENFTD